MIVTYCYTSFRGENGCNLLFLTIKHVFENCGGSNFPVAYPLVAGLPHAVTFRNIKTYLSNVTYYSNR